MISQYDIPREPILPTAGIVWRVVHRGYRLVYDGFDAVRWARCPFETARAIVPLPQSWLKVRVLNSSPGRPPGSVDPLPVGEALAVLRNLLESELLADGRVDYTRLSESSVFKQLCDQSALLEGIRPESFRNDAERIAFWLNVYNALSIHGVIAFRIRRSVMEVPSFFIRTAYRIGDHVFTLDDVSNGVLRRRGRRPTSGRRQFGATDARLAYCAQRVDPRIHGALVCASASCPPVAYYDPSRVDEQLDLASGNFVNQLVRLDMNREELHLPLHFYYYAEDFGGAPGIAKFLLRHLVDPLRAQARRALDARWRVRWDRYDWVLNVGA